MQLGEHAAAEPDKGHASSEHTSSSLWSKKASISRSYLSLPGGTSAGMCRFGPWRVERAALWPGKGTICDGANDRL